MWIKWWKNKNFIKMLIITLILMGVCFITAYYINNIYGLLLVFIELFIGTIPLRKYKDIIVMQIFDYLENSNKN